MGDAGRAVQFLRKYGLKTWLKTFTRDIKNFFRQKYLLAAISFAVAAQQEIVFEAHIFVVLF